MLTELGTIALGMPIDNLSIDSEGDIFAVGFPDIMALMRSLENPEVVVASTVFRVVREDGENGEEGEDGGKPYEVSKVLEDIGGKTLPASTVAVHDVVRDMYWPGGVSSGCIGVCERK